MPCCRLLLFFAVGGAAVAAGCAHINPSRPSPDDPAPLTLLPETARTPLVPTIELPAPKVVPNPPTSLRRVTARDTQELAVRNSGAAKLLEREPTGEAKRRGHDSPSSKQLALAHAADEARNRSAGDALDLFYKLAGAEAGIDQARAAAKDIDALLVEVRAAARAGLKERGDPAELEEQLVHVRSEEARLTGAAIELNAGLKALLGLSNCPEVRLWPDDPLRVSGETIDPEEAVRVGLRYRPDLLLLRTLVSSPDPAATGVARQVLVGVNPALSGPPLDLPFGVRIVVKVFAPCARWPDPGNRTATLSQVADLLAERERQAEAEIRAAVGRAVAAAEQARLYAVHASSQRARLTELEKERAAGRAVAAEEAKARAALRKTEGEKLKAAVEHLSAVARLKQAQGLLVREVLDPSFCGPVTE